MSKVAIMTDSNSGITQAQAKELGIVVLPMPFYINGEQFLEDITLNQEQFYARLAEGCDVSTSQPSPDTVMSAWDKLLEEYDEIVHIPMSSGLSSSFENAWMLAKEEPYEGRVFVCDNQRISVTQRQSVLDAIDMAAKGMSGKEIYDITMATKWESSIYIMVDTLKYLKKGGRVTPAAAALGTILRIKPVLQIQGEKLDSFAKARTIKNAKKIMIDAVAKDWKERFNDAPCHLAMAHTQNYEEIEVFKKEVVEAFPNAGHIQVDPLSLSVGCHIGPGSLALTITKKLDI